MHNGNTLSMSAYKKHINLYVEILNKYKTQLMKYKVNKNAICLLYDKEIEVDLLKKLLKIV